MSEVEICSIHERVRDAMKRPPVPSRPSCSAKMEVPKTLIDTRRVVFGNERAIDSSKRSRLDNENARPKQPKRTNEQRTLP